MIQTNNFNKNSIIIRFAETIFQSLLPGHKRKEDEISIRDEDFVDKIIKCADIFDIEGYKVKSIHATDLKWKEIGKTMYMQMEFEFEKNNKK